MFVLRSPENYDYHCTLLNGALAETDSVTYGVNYSSVLNKLVDFDMCNGQLPQDMMHILLEGAVPSLYNKSNVTKLCLWKTSLFYWPD